MFATIGSFVRGWLGRQVHEIMFEHLMEVQLVLDLCEAIFIARSVREFEMEETLYRKLIRLFRDPGLLLRLLRRRRTVGLHTYSHN